MIDDKDIAILNRYLERFYPEGCSKNLHGKALEEISYSKWAVESIIDQAVKEASKLPKEVTGIEREPLIDLIRDFIYTMDDYILESKSDSQRFIFEVAKDEASTVLFYVCQEYWDLQDKRIERENEYREFERLFVGC